MNYVDPEATRPATIGPCSCPVQGLHEQDTAVVKARFDYGDTGLIRQAGRAGGPEAMKVTMVVRGVVSWNLVLPNGKPRPVDLAQANRLDELTVERLVEAMDESWSDDPLPNPSGDPSPDGSQTEGSPTPTTPTPPSSTTP